MATQASSHWATQAYTAAYLGAVFKVEGILSFLPILFLGGAAAGIVGYAVGVPILRLRDDFLAIATLGFGILVRVLLDNSDRLTEVLGGSRGFIGIPKIVNLEIAFFTIVFLILVTRNLIFSRYGLFWQCIKDDELASTTFGINTARMKLMAFTYGCFLAGIGGALYAYLYSFLHPSNFDFLRSIDFLIIVIVGGMGSITGTIYAGLLWVAVIEGLRIGLPAQVLEFRWVLIPIFLIIVMMWKPFGLLARKESKFLGLDKGA
jgi:branched-chain amino acid transport system permease protein